MPFELPEIFALLVGLIETLLAAGAAFVGNLIAKLVPDISFLSFHLRSLVVDLWDHTVGGWLIDKAGRDTGAAKTVTTVTYGTGTVAKKTVAAINHVGDQIASLNNHAIPQAKNDAVSAANAYTDRATQPLSDRINNVTTEANNIAGSVTHLTDYVNGQFRQAIEADIRTSVDQGTAAAERQANTDVSNLAAQIATALQNIYGQVQQLDVLATQTLPAEITQVANAAAAARLATQQADAAQLSKDVAALQDEINQAVASGDQALAAQKRLEQAALASSVATLQSGIAIDQTNIDTLRQSIATVITPAIAAVAASVASITTEYNDCAVTTCDGPNNWRNLLGTFTQGATLAELVTFLAEAAKDPGGEAKALAGIGDNLYHAGHALIDGLLSL